jgi:hypothetical protein
VTDEVTRSAAKVATLVAVPLALVAGLVAFLVLSDVLSAPETPTTPVEIAERDLTERQDTVCRALLSQLPDDVREFPQRPVTEGPEQNAAYGEPPLTIECGVPPAQFPPTDTVYPLDGVCFHAAQEEGRSVWVTVDREVPVRVTVPDTYDGAGQWVAEFSRTIASTVPLAPADEIPSGCSA